ECIVGRLPEKVPFLAANRNSLAQMPDLRSWSSEDGLNREAVDAAYIGSFKLFRAIAIVLGKKTLEREMSTWDAVEAALDADGSRRARRIMRVIEGGVDKQRSALLDEDRDDLCELQELLMGTDPELWDSDGDGWWDGASPEHPQNGLPLPRDGSLLCGLYRSQDEGVLKVTHHGSMRGYNLASADFSHDERDLLVSMSDKMMMHPGGTWIELQGSDLEPNPRCHWTPRLTIAAGSDTVADQLEPLAQAVEMILDDTSERFGRPVDHRLVIQVKGLETDWAHQGVQHPVVLPIEHLEWASTPEKMNIVAAQVVAMYWLGYAGDSRLQSLAASVALSRFIAPEGAKHQIAVAFANDVRLWTKLADKCKDGWAGVLRHECVQK
ncbi:MAG: hypothetical protein HN348_28560, partial [Proteobacteria bacterium]|nr:hypothetical protein [Pseudomonadota bacterium]